MTYPGSPYPPPHPAPQAAPPATPPTATYPAPYSYPTSMWPTQTFRPVGVRASGSLVCAGIAAACAVVGGLIEPAKDFYSVSHWLQTGILAMAGVALIATYFFLGFWQMAVKANLAEQREETGSTWLIWVGWLFVIPSLFVPLLVMSKLNVRNPVHNKWLALWWAGWLAAQVGLRDLVTYRGGSVTVSTSAGIFLIFGALASFTGFYVVIRGISRNHVAQPTGPAVWNAPSDVMPVYGPDGTLTWATPPPAPHLSLGIAEYPTDTAELLRRRF